MLKTQIKVETRGSPNIKELPKAEQEIFFDTIYKRILQLNSEKNNK